MHISSHPQSNIIYVKKKTYLASLLAIAATVPIIIGAIVVQDSFTSTLLICSGSFIVFIAISVIIKNRKSINRLNAQNEVQRKPTKGRLVAAIEKEDIREVISLLRLGSNPNETDKDNESALRLAITRGNLELISALLSGNANPNEITQEGYSIISFTINVIKNTNIRLKTIEMLLNAGADPNKADKEDGFTPLLRAIQICDLSLVKLLVSHGVDVKSKIASAINRPLYQAWMLGPSGRPIFEYLISQGADVNEEDRVNYPNGTLLGLVIDQRKKNPADGSKNVEYLSQLGARTIL